ncbi:uncharacterized protein E0L32_004876 [Thyridium curvatum]|uniref:NodB homology domain-containing protein n=1 Tax=Thyridium curvatum TaxID=1093900 RepID=A0A507B7D4_9PEZI|nr:uncharacterized protein E0L32_004876 [Thyridium curvatum]TPX15046.1 hypothetical protein E0L32_004876 [Thyridium curvatum]
MHAKSLSGWLAAIFVAGVNAACSKDLLIDDFSNFVSSTNSLKDATSDDGTMASIGVNNGVLSFVPQSSDSYYYESFPCVQAKSQNYGGLTFNLKYPPGSSFTLEIQTKANCNAADYKSEWFLIEGLGGTQQSITLDLRVFAESNLDAIVGFVWASWSPVNETWSLSNVHFTCGSLDERQAPLIRAAASRPARPALSQIPLEKSSLAPTTTQSFAASYIHRGSISTRQSASFFFSSTSNSKSLMATSSSLQTSPSFSTATRPATSVWPSGSPDQGVAESIPIDLVRRAAAVSDIAEATTRRTIIRPSPTSRPKPAAGQCQDLVVDDWESQSRLTFLGYNALKQASSDDGSMASLVVNADNTVTITPQDSNSYFYSQLGCVDAVDTYGGLAFNIKAARGTTFSVQLSSASECGGNDSKKTVLTTKSLGWTFDGTMQSYSVPISQFNVDNTKLTMIYLSSFSRAVTLGPMGFYCGNDDSPIPTPNEIVNPQPTFTVAAPPGSADTLVIDGFGDQDENALGQWHGCDEDCVTAKWARNRVTLQTNDSDLSWYTSLADKCADISAYADSYLHIAYTGSSKFTVALQQHNQYCNDKVQPTPETWDSLEAARYADGKDIYMPISHFKVDLTRVTNFAFKGFYTTEPVTLTKVELVPSVPRGFKVPNKLPSGNLVFACKRPNSFAFAIDDGDPALAQQVMDIVKSENIKVTFFTVGLPLEDPTTNLSAVYRDMMSRGHQIALHSFTHPKMEGLPNYAAIDWEYNNDIEAVSQTFDGLHTPYFRPPFGTEGARMRQRLATALGVDNPYVVMWSVDVEDWLWAESSTPEKQLDAFKRDLNKGGSLVVMHYLYPNTVKYLRQFIQLAKATGKQLMRVDQCMMDPNAPPL